MIVIAFTDGFMSNIPALNCRSGSSVRDHLDALEKQVPCPTSGNIVLLCD